MCERKSAIRLPVKENSLVNPVFSKICYLASLFVILYPRDNHHVRDAVAKYRYCLSDDSSFTEWTLEDVYSRIKKYSTAGWIDLFFDRYLAFDKVTARLKQ